MYFEANPNMLEFQPYKWAYLKAQAMADDYAEQEWFVSIFMIISCNRLHNFICD